MPGPDAPSHGGHRWRIAVVVRHLDFAGTSPIFPESLLVFVLESGPRPWWLDLAGKRLLSINIETRPPLSLRNCLVQGSGRFRTNYFFTGRTRSKALGV